MTIAQSDCAVLQCIFGQSLEELFDSSSMQFWTIIETWLADKIYRHFGQTMTQLVTALWFTVIRRQS